MHLRGTAAFLAPAWGAPARRPRVRDPAAAPAPRPVFRVARRIAPVAASALGAQGAAGTPWDHGREARDRELRARDVARPAPESAPDIGTGAQLSAASAAEAVAPAATAAPAAPLESSNAAAQQVDDGSLASPVSYIPRKLVRRPTRRSKLSLANARERFLAGFDTGIGGTVVLLGLFAMWYGSNAVFNVYNKQVLRVFPYPLTCTVAQFAVGSLAMGMLWLLRIKRAPPFSRAVAGAVAPLAACHAAGFLLTNMSLGKVSVAFTHTVKATEPFFSVALTPSILGDIPTWGILGSLFPIVAGVALASLTEVSFNWIGFLSAVGSNVALQSRNVLSKKLMKQQKDVADRPGSDPIIAKRAAAREEALTSLDNINLFTAMTICALLFLAPVSLLWEGTPLLAASAGPAMTGMSKLQLWSKLAIGGFCRCLDVLSSYMILKRVSPVTHSVGNCVKRAVVIVVSIIFFKTQITSLSVFGTVLALAGVLLYSVIVAACKQNTFGPESPVCKPIYESELELLEGGGI